MIAVQGERVSRRIAITIAALLFFAFVAVGLHLHPLVYPGDRAFSTQEGGRDVAAAPNCLLCHLAREAAFPAVSPIPFRAPPDTGSLLSASAEANLERTDRAASSPRAPPPAV